MLFITHDMGVVAEIADRTVVMYPRRAGGIRPNERYLLPRQTPVTRALLSAVPVLGSMGGRDRPMRFPVADTATGLSDISRSRRQIRLHSGNAPVLEVRNLTKHFDIHSGLFSRLSGRVHAVENRFLRPPCRRDSISGR